ncbi:MAG: hypothetical protein HY892_15185 [Deltaproteobacteria bacterium]|nr:hypothetical protein [Deltaproteobacteria bacterium]
MKKVFVLIVFTGLLACFSFGCSKDTGEAEVNKFYSEKIAAVNAAARALAAAKNTDQAAAELEKGYKVLREAVAQEEFLFNQYPRVKETQEIQKFQEDYLAASEKFSREVEALPTRLVPDRTMIEALHKIKSGFKPTP